jgi:hypothetical protein
MIGFSQEFKDISNASTEGPDTCNLQKNELYELVAKDFFLPPIGSRGVTREYLLSVKEDRVFHITNYDWKHFEFKMERGHLRRSAIVNNAILIRKLNMLLRSRNQKELGFSEFDIPEQNWLYKMARYIDRTNLLEFFEQPVENEATPTHHSSAIIKIHFGRLYAGEYLFADKVKRSNKKLWHSLKVLSEAHRMLLSYKMSIALLEHDLTDTKKKVVEQESTLQDLLSKASFASRKVR